MSETVLDVYEEALYKISPSTIGSAPLGVEELLRSIIVDYASRPRQSREARIARKALKDVAYLKMQSGPE